MVNVTIQKTEEYILAEGDVKDAIAFYINQHYGTEFGGRDVKFSISDSDSGDGMGGSWYEPAKINHAKITKVT